MSYFAGKLEGCSISDLRQKLDYTITDPLKRREIVDEIIQTGFFEQYFDNHFKVHINTGENLSEYNNVCRFLESMGTYLIESEEALVDDDTKLYDSKELIKRMNTEESIESLSGNCGDGTVLHNIQKNKVGAIAKNKSYKLPRWDNINFGSADSEIKYQYNTLDDADKRLIDSYVNYYNRIDKTKAINQFQVSNIKFKIKQDIETILKGSKEIVHDNLQSYSDSYFNNNEDLTIEDLKYRHTLTGLTYKASNGDYKRDTGILFNEIKVENDINNELYLVKLELDSMVKRANLTDTEKNVLDLTRKGLTVREIGAILDMAIGMVSTHKSKIVDKVMKEINKEKENV